MLGPGRTYEMLIAVATAQVTRKQTPVVVLSAYELEVVQEDYRQLGGDPSKVHWLTNAIPLPLFEQLQKEPGPVFVDHALVGERAFWSKVEKLDSAWVGWVGKTVAFAFEEERKKREKENA